MTRETVLTAESKRDEVHISKVWNNMEQSIIISDSKIDVPPILGGLDEGK